MRLYLFRDNFPFSAEMGVIFLDIKNILYSGQNPFIGPATSHPWLHLGPLFYWMFIPVFLLGDFNPLIPAILLAILSTFIVFENYFVMRKIFDEKTALVSSYLIAISPYFIYHAKVAQYYSLVLVFFYPFLYFVHSNWLWAGIFLGIILNFHLSAVILIPGSLVFMFMRKQLNRQNLFKFFIGISIFQFLFLISNQPAGLAGFKFLIWLPYRVVTHASLLDLPQTLITFVLSTFVPYGSFFPH